MRFLTRCSTVVVIIVDVNCYEQSTATDAAIADSVASNVYSAINDSNDLNDDYATTPNIGIGTTVATATTTAATIAAIVTTTVAITTSFNQ